MDYRDYIVMVMSENDLELFCEVLENHCVKFDVGVTRWDGEAGTVTKTWLVTYYACEPELHKNLMRWFSAEGDEKKRILSLIEE